MVDIWKLRGKIREKGYTQADIAKALNVSPNTISRKLSRSEEFKASEMQKLHDLLDLENYADYFFVEDVK